MKKTFVFATLVLAFILAACSPVAPTAAPAIIAPTTAPATSAPTAAPATTAPTTAPATAAPNPTDAPTAPAAAKPAAVATDLPEMSGDFQANGHSLYLKCLGTGTPTIVLEAGEGGSVTQMQDLQKTLAGRTTTCAYSRANIGRSGSAPTPRTAKDVVDDLHALLAAAKVPGPYLLVGQYAGALFDQLYARTYPDQVVGVVAMDPQQEAHPWIDEIKQVVTEQEYASEQRSLGGQNEESIDYLGSTAQFAAAPQPPNVPFEMLISPCDPGDQFCVKTDPTYRQIMQQVTATWPRGTLSEVAAGEISINHPDAVVAAVERILAKQ